MQDLIDGYQQTKRMLRALRTLNTDAAERGLLGGMISDCEYAIEWLESGRRPGNKRGVERRAGYQRERPIDPIRIQSYVMQSTAGSPANITDWERWQIDEALRTLTPLERACYEMAAGQGIGHGDIASMLGISRGNVSTLLGRAEEKIKINKISSLFLQ
jgi:RNA polymerase sigma-70 factor (ECF subfamily)